MFNIYRIFVLLLYRTDVHELANILANIKCVNITSRIVICLLVWKLISKPINAILKIIFVHRLETQKHSDS